MYNWLTVFSPRAVNFSLGRLSTNWKYPHSQSASWNDFRGPSVQALPHSLRVSLARARSLFRPLLPSACYAGYHVASISIIDNKYYAMVSSDCRKPEKCMFIKFPQWFERWFLLVLKKVDFWFDHDEACARNKGARLTTSIRKRSIDRIPE